MHIESINHSLALGQIDNAEQFPRLAQLKRAPFQFKFDFGLKELPTSGGILVVRGARQYGKSTWLELEIKKSVETFGAGSTYYINGDYLAHLDELEQAITTLLPLFAKSTPVKRIFIDEICAVPRWELVLKRLADRGVLKDVLIITTGSKSTDLRRASERLPGRKGQLTRTNYLFTPVSYAEFYRVCHKTLGKKTLLSYLISGGSPIACSELASTGFIPEYIIELTRDWIEGEIAFAGRSRAALLNIFQVIFRFAGTPVGQAKLAREANLANNTVAAGYIELLNDLACIVPAYAWDIHKKNLILRKPCKYHITNLLAAIAYHPQRIRSIKDFLNLPTTEQGKWYEWLVAQELLRRNALCGENILAPLAFWQSKEHEIDFVLENNAWIEVKRGRSSPLEFSWLAHTLPKQELLVINNESFETQQLYGLSLEDFLLQHS